MFPARGPSGGDARLMKRAEEFLNDLRPTKKRFQSLLAFIGTFD